MWSNRLEQLSRRDFRLKLQKRPSLLDTIEQLPSFGRGGELPELASPDVGLLQAALLASRHVSGDEFDVEDMIDDIRDLTKRVMRRKEELAAKVQEGMAHEVLEALNKPFEGSISVKRTAEEIAVSTPPPSPRNQHPCHPSSNAVASIPHRHFLHVSHPSHHLCHLRSTRPPPHLHRNLQKLDFWLPHRLPDTLEASYLVCSVVALDALRRLDVPSEAVGFVGAPMQMALKTCVMGEDLPGLESVVEVGLPWFFAADCPGQLVPLSDRDVVYRLLDGMCAVAMGESAQRRGACSSRTAASVVGPEHAPCMWRCLCGYV